MKPLQQRLFSLRGLCLWFMFYTQKNLIKFTLDTSNLKNHKIPSIFYIDLKIVQNEKVNFEIIRKNLEDRNEKIFNLNDTANYELFAYC